MSEHLDKREPITSSTSASRGRWTDEVLEPFRSMGEPVADGVIQKVFADDEVETVNRMLKSIQSNVHLVPAEMPDAVEEYLNQTDDSPEWADAEKVRLGQRLFQRYGSCAASMGADLCLSSSIVRYCSP